MEGENVGKCWQLLVLVTGFVPVDNCDGLDNVQKEDNAGNVGSS